MTNENYYLDCQGPKLDPKLFTQPRRNRLLALRQWSRRLRSHFRSLARKWLNRRAGWHFVKVPLIQKRSILTPTEAKIWDYSSSVTDTTKLKVGTTHSSTPDMRQNCTADPVG